jgi:tetratricopeptide (TPR) repeat protein
VVILFFRSEGRAAMLPALFLSLASLLTAQSDELALKSQRAKQLMEVGQYEQAVPIYRQLVQAVPGNPGLLLNLALALHMAGHDREAIPHLESVLKIQPNAVPALIALGTARLATGQPTLAIAPLDKAVGLAPKDAEARGLLADALTAANRFDQAAEQYRKLTDFSPDDPRAWYGLGMTYQGMALNAFDRLQKQNATSPYVSALAADARVQRRQYSSAYFFYNEALKQLPNLHGIHAALAEVYRKTGRPDWAAAEDAKERQLPAPDCKAHPAECQFIGGHDLEAATLPKAVAASPEALFWQAKAANELALQAFFRLGQLPPSLELHQLRAEIARSQNQHLESVNEWRAALELSPGNPRLEQELAVSLFMAQDYRPAFDEAAALLKSDPRSPELNFVAGDSLLRLEEPEKAVTYLRAALEADPKLVAAHASLGLALMRVGKSAEAVPHLEKSLELDDDGSLHYQLARAYQATGDRDKARTAMEQYQEILKTSQQQKEEAAREAQIGPPRP